MIDPGRGASEARAAAAKLRIGPASSDYLDLFRTPTFLYNTAGMAAVTFATGAYAAWGSTFYQRVYRPDGDARPASGSACLLVAAGLLGIVLGMFLPDLLRKLTRRAYLLLAAFAVLAATPAGRRRHPRPAITIRRWPTCSARRSCCRWFSGRATP